MTTIDIWVNKELQVIGIILHNVDNKSWLHCSIGTLLHVIRTKHESYGTYGCNPKRVLYEFDIYNKGKYYHYTTVSFNSLDELLPLLSQQYPELLL